LDVNGWNAAQLGVALAMSLFAIHEDESEGRHFLYSLVAGLNLWGGLT
jgi:hypothetical protein